MLGRKKLSNIYFSFDLTFSEIILCFFKINIHKISGISISQYAYSKEGKYQWSVIIRLVHKIKKYIGS
jgi:hypothetical protein